MFLLESVGSWMRWERNGSGTGDGIGRRALEAG
jgi:hypothetical protein